MKQCYILLLALSIIYSSPKFLYAATVGNPLDLDLPARSGILRQDAINNTLDECEQMVKVKGGVDLEFIFDKNLKTTHEVTSAEIEGQYYMAKLGTTFFSIVEPYVKVGTSNLEVKWLQNENQDIKVEADYGFTWGGGVKVVLWDSCVRLTLDGQYRSTEPDIEDVTIVGVGMNPSGGDFQIEEWQAAIVLSKKYEVPLRWQDVYIVPYLGLTLSDSNVDVAVTDPSNPEITYSLYDASDKHLQGFLLGCDIMPTLTSSFIYSLEVRLNSEIALTLGGTMKF